MNIMLVKYPYNERAPMKNKLKVIIFSEDLNETKPHNGHGVQVFLLTLETATIQMKQ